MNPLLKLLKMQHNMSVEELLTCLNIQDGDLVKSINNATQPASTEQLMALIRVLVYKLIWLEDYIEKNIYWE